MKYMATVFAVSLLVVFIVIYAVIVYTTGEFDVREWGARMRAIHAFSTVLTSSAITTHITLLRVLD